eukprot:5316117-Pleurochrysis_carterae.AAC.1
MAAAGHGHDGHRRTGRLAQQLVRPEAPGHAAVGLLDRREQANASGRRTQPHCARAAGSHAPRGHAGDPLRLQ